ncbi:TPA: MarR family transcriptional regulator [Clostridioides difficile]|uniref:MarR family winged helix-turn-helix transcriptional regulator n=2 Tax=Clostridioides difficile TaxID=1496 RepID=UPI00038D4478|nr:MarR family transcriptional regulator [Clostridioides difficile]EGT4249076.1 MarR family transcriptional regulator [Clostridioides difficile]EGT4521441.1 MarR family transcriptional regulator [Clostridioides difficile]EGT4548907.1 MarR family transcriptional regulator [Clostridioides difficile]EGT4616578.1 MarR family transcriptional regulator [Clostridioides difficile]EGT4637473.1 MarR family transcriptional regulator [Clostridioides difficile]
MDAESLMKKYMVDDDSRKQAIFASIFVMQNKLQTTCDKLDPELTMKQWLLLAIADSVDETLTLTKLGELMGCSRQNVKKLAIALEKKGFIEIEQNEKDSRAICLVTKDRVEEYSKKVRGMQEKVLQLLFEDFTEKEAEQLFFGIMKLSIGIENVKNYVENNDVGE